MDALPPDMADAIVLRVSMDRRAEPDSAAPAAGHAVAAPAEAKEGLIAEFDPTRRKVNMSLHHGGHVYGVWSFTASDLNVPFDPEALVHLQDRFFVGSAIASGVSSFAARCAQSLSDRFPAWITLNRLDMLRQSLSFEPSLPLVIWKPLREALELLEVQDKGVLWLETAEPAGFLPLLPWEKLLSRTVDVPVLHVARKPGHGTRRRGSLDVVLACTSSDERLTAPPKTVVSLCKALLGATAPGKRCVVHLFADQLHREPIQAELAGSGLPVVEEGEPPERRGVVLYRLPEGEERARMEPSDAEVVRTQTVWERPWAAWIKNRTAGCAIDVVHVISNACFAGLQPTLEITASPWEKPQAVRRSWTLRWVNKVQLRYVDAALLCDFATGLGAWGIVFSAPNAECLRAERVLSYQASALLPGVFAVHDLAQDPQAQACPALYGFLAGRAGSTDPQPVIPHSTALSIRCNAAMLQPEAADARIKASLGEDFAQALQDLKEQIAGMDATPAWAAVVQRQIALTASTSLATEPLTERDKAARDGVTQALTVALSTLAKHLKS